MPRASWKGFLRLSLVSCPVYLSPATSRTKAIRLNQVWVPRPRPTEPVEAEEDEEPTGPRRGHGISQRAPELVDNADEEPEYTAAATRIALRPHDPHTGEEIDRDEVRKGYEYERGQFVTFTPEELKALDVESSHTIDQTTSCRVLRSIRCTSTHPITCTRADRLPLKPIARSAPQWLKPAWPGWGG